MARGKRPDTFRTRKLSLSAPMVLPRGRGGRVGRRRTTIPEGAPPTRWGPFVVPGTTIHAFLAPHGADRRRCHKGSNALPAQRRARGSLDVAPTLSASQVFTVVNSRHALRTS